MKSTILRQVYAVVTLIFIGSWLASPVDAQQQTGLEIYTRTDPPSGWFGSPAIDGFWTQRGKGSTGSLSVPANGSLYFAFENGNNDLNTKSFSVEFSAESGDIYDLGVGTVAGIKDDGTTDTSTVDAGAHKSALLGLLTVNATFDPQPEWEYIEITNSSGQAKSIKVNSADSRCSGKRRSTGNNNIPNSRMDFSNGMFAAEGNQPNTTLVTEIELFPRNVDVDLAVAPTLDAPPASGNWTPEFVFIDPNGDPRPHGGVRWVSDGPGLAAGELHDLSLTMTGAADSSYVIFGLDSAVGQYQEVFIDIGDTPWYEDFETHFPDVGCAGWRNWKGWDNDPAFDAPATGELAHDGAHSIRIDGDADIVRDFKGIDTGAWSFTAWQYIPSDFTSGGSGQFRGSHFLLLNRYRDGGPYHWSVDLQVDSVSGLMKVYHGDNTNTVDIPYVTDRWTKIQVIIDLEDDWTQVYYDDALVTEYAWTGGILGNGGGLSKIRVVDLYANGSSPIYYDDLSLEPINSGTEPVCPGRGVLVEGTGETGDVDATCGADDLYWGAHGEIFAFQISDPVVQFELTATAPNGFGGGTINVDIEASKESDNASLNLRAQLFDFAAGNYVALPGIMPLSTADAVQSFALPVGSEPNDFIDPGTGEVRLLLQTIQTSGLPNVRTQLDQVLFRFD